MHKALFIIFVILGALLIEVKACFGQEKDSIKIDSVMDSNKTKAKKFAPRDTTLLDSLSKQNLIDSLNNQDSIPRKSKKQKPIFERQLRFMVDISHPIGAILNPNNYTFELNTDYNPWKDAFVVLEGGYGGGSVNYDNLKYKSQNGFIRLGIEKSFFDPLYTGDWDMVTLGIRYGMAIGQRGAATYIIPNPFGGNSSAQTEPKNFFNHWGEATIGLRFELLPQLYTGWQIRMKFNLSANSFLGQVAPNNIAGYGPGEQPTNFGFNYYLGYAIKWKK
ncbi:MAG TPA: DUF6048 family protein [Edaphocola sp.]|nr:DUF6048 family protein [Edaphocola sp.]